MEEQVHNLVFDETLLEGSTEERVAKAKALLAAGCMLIQRSITRVARGCLGRKERSGTAFIKWCYGQIGIHLSLHAQLQCQGMRRDRAWGEAQPSDLICFVLPQSRKLVPRNGIVTEQRTVIYVSPIHGEVVERTFEELASCELRGIRLMLPAPMQRKTDVIRLPAGRGLEPTKETVRLLINAHLAKVAAE
ncbi:MAG: hypothetical protein ABIO72_01265 [Patescibacteria group bacterium]